MTNIKTTEKEIWRWTATEIAHGVRTGAISAREAVQSSLNRIEDTNPALNAIVELSAGEALAAADEADRMVKRGDELGPLHGVPVTIKMNTDQAGHATVDGVLAYKNAMAEADSPQVKSLRDAGGIMVGRTNTPAFSLRWFANNDVYGRTLSPWNRDHTPGGSSGGASSSVAAGMVPISHGNDIGGSIRYPAYACGIYGIRPTVGRVSGWVGPADGDQSLSFQSMWVQGPIARSVSDLRLGLQAMSKPDFRDPWFAPAPLTGAPLRRPIKVGVVRGEEIVKLHPGVAQAIDKAAGWLKDAGYQVEEIKVPAFEEAYKLWYLLCIEELRPQVPFMHKEGDDGIRGVFETYFAAARQWWPELPTLGDYMKGYARRGTLIAQVQKIFQEYPILLLPISAEPPFEQDADYLNRDRGVEVIRANWGAMAIPMLSLPGISAPVHVFNGLPCGVQMIGPKFREDILLTAGEVLEARTDVRTPIDPR